MRKKKLGKGLDALIPKELEEQIRGDDETDKVPSLLPINSIEPDLGQPRKNFDEDEINELAESISNYGLLQPIIVTKTNKMYTIIAGERRWRASKKAGLKKVPVIVKDYDKKERLEVSLIENIQRKDLNAVEEAIAYQKLIDEFDLRQEEIASRVGKSRSAIANTLRLLALDDRVKEMIKREMLSMGNARALLAIEEGDIQYELAMKIFDNKWSVRETERYIKSLFKEKKTTSKSKKKPAEIQDIERRIGEALGSKVNISQRAKDKGKIEVNYNSLDDLERIIAIMTGIDAI